MKSSNYSADVDTRRRFAVLRRVAGACQWVLEKQTPFADLAIVTQANADSVDKIQA